VGCAFLWLLCRFRLGGVGLRISNVVVDLDQDEVWVLDQDVVLDLDVVWVKDLGEV